ncbi:MAG: CapA family protein [Treponema sp.]|jgi:poly-gamma-glutamate synthesis protein (capsule biosynthesis protein)|nr:CapA family protein [Treponema sp.]
MKVLSGPVLSLVLLGISCGAGVDLVLDYEGIPEPDRTFLALALTDQKLRSLGIRRVPEITAGTPSILRAEYLSFWTSWEDSGDPDSSQPGRPLDFPSGSVETFIPLSRTCMVPRAEIGEEKTGLTLDEAYGAGLVPLAELAPPYLALKVDGMDVEDPAYPLVLLGGLKLAYVSENGQDEKELARIGKKYEALERLAAEFPRGSLASPWDARPRLYRIAAGGDAVLSRGVPALLFTGYDGTAGDDGVAGYRKGEIYYPRPGSAEEVLGGTASLVQGADLSLLNLEGVITSRGEKTGKTYTFRFDPRSASFLRAAGFDAVLLANNHAFDFGLTGFLDSLEYLEAAGVAILGAGRNQAAAAAPFLAGYPGLAVQVFGLASFKAERNGWDGLSAAADENRAGLLHAGRGGAELIQGRLRKDRGILDIVFFHGGEEYTDRPDGPTRALYTELIMAGADLVIGTHPHVEQGFEWVLGKPVLWSLGDYIFDEMDDTPGGNMGILVVLSYAGDRLLYLEPHPLFMRGPRTEIAPKKQLERFYRLSQELAERVEGYVQL